MVFKLLSSLDFYEDTNTYISHWFKKVISMLLSATVYVKLDLLLLKTLQSTGGKYEDNSSKEWQEKPQAGRKYLWKTSLFKDYYAGSLIVINVLLWHRRVKLCMCGVIVYVGTLYYPLNFALNPKLLSKTKPLKIIKPVNHTMREGF